MSEKNIRKMLGKDYENSPVELHLSVTVFVLVSTTAPAVYFFAVAVAEAVLPVLLAEELVIFQFEFNDFASTSDLVHTEVPLPYLNVPVTFTYHRFTPLEF